MESHVKIFLDSIEIPLKIGIYEHEMLKPQRVVVDVALYADANSYLSSVNVDTIVDYAVIYEAVQGWAGRTQVLLIEDYLKELVELCFKHEQVVACKAAINKIDVFGVDQGAGVEVYTTRTDWDAA